MTRFSWRAEGEDSWNDEEWPTEPGKPRARRSWLAITTVVVLIGVAVLVISRRVDERVEEATAAATDDLFSSLNLARGALNRQDEEIFASLLSGREEAWTDTQLLLFRQGLLLDRRFVGLEAILDETTLGPLASGDPSLLSMELAPDLSEGQVVVKQPYTVTGQRGTSEQVLLAQTYLFRRGSQRWLWSPPGEDFWSSSVLHEANYLTAHYPDRDAVVAERLVKELDAAIRQLCFEFLDRGCPEELHLSVRFSTDPRSLVLAADPEHQLALEQSVEVPAITLVGVPVDESGHKAIFQAYARQVLPAAFIAISQWECCASAAFFGALLDYELSEIGVKPWPVSEASYQRLLLEGVDLNQVGRLWTIRDIGMLSGEEGWKIYLSIDFLIQNNPELTAQQLVAEMSPGRSFSRWIEAIYADRDEASGEASLMAQLDDAWWSFATVRAAGVGIAPPIPLPEQELMLMCGDLEGSGKAAILAYSPVEAAWSEMPLGDGYFVVMQPIEGTQQMILSSIVFDEEEQVERWQTVLWRPESQVQEILDGQVSLTLGQVDPTGEKLLVYAFSQDDGLPIPTLVDLASCQASTCDETVLARMPLWSPDGKFLILSEAESLGQNPLIVRDRTVLLDVAFPSRTWQMWLGTDSSIVLGDGQVVKEIEAGFAPFWIDEETYGFLVNLDQQADQPVEAVMIGSVNEASRQAVVDSETVGATLPAPQPAAGRSGEVARWHLKLALVDPADPSQLVLMLGSSFGAEAHYVQFDRETGAINPLFAGRVNSGSSIAFSPESRWLLVDGRDDSSASPDAPETQLTLYEMATGKSQSYPTQMTGFVIPANYDWSADGQWLAILASDRAVNLVAPAHDYQQVIIRPPSTCTALAWISP